MRALLLRMTSAARVPGTDRREFVLEGDEGHIRVETNAPRWLEKLGPGGAYRMTIEPEAEPESSE